ncbi:hypothetical protein GLYMA_02G128250v4 [Glycine max]|nr:hypothetical protein GLYMA_02G128250v4 [Glycine max]KAH1060065.1 hypothetical protein GYH30_003853 [Glycine max]
MESLRLLLLKVVLPITTICALWLEDCCSTPIWLRRPAFSSISNVKTALSSYLFLLFVHKQTLIQHKTSKLMSPGLPSISFCLEE